jgi:hypothetical protein
VLEELELHLNNTRDITNKIKMGKGNVTDDTIADIDKTENNLTSYITKMLAVHFLVRNFHFLDHFIFFICFQVDQEKAMAIKLIKKIAIQAIQTKME